MGTKMCRISVRTTLVFTPKVDILDFWVLFSEKSFSKNWKIGYIGPHGPQFSQCSPIGKNFFQKKYPKIQNVNFGGENQSCSHRNSAHFGTHTVSWGPLNDSFPDFQFFPKFPGIAISVFSGIPPGIAISVFSGIPQGSPSPSAQAAPLPGSPSLAIQI